MTFKLKRGLWLWVGTLTMALLVIIPLTLWIRAAAMLAVVVWVVMAWKRIGKRARRQSESLVIADNLSLPQASYRQPVVLVCGDGLVGLFGAISAEQLALRITGQGCYVRVPSLELLPALTDNLLALRPDWGRQLGVMFIVNAQEHADSEVLAGRVRTLRHQLTRVRKGGIALPLMLVSYLQAARGEGPWFNWRAGQASPEVREAGECVSLAQWQVQAANSATRAARLQTGVQLNSAAAWLAQTVLPHLACRETGTPDGRLVTSAITLVAAMPSQVAGNLWQRWLRAKIALVDPRQIPPGTSASLPFPDPLLTLLPSDTRYSPNRRARVIALWLFTAAALVALASSAWQNTLLMRQVSDDLRQYASIAPTETLRKQEALAVLRQDASRLAIRAASVNSWRCVMNWPS